MSRGGLIIYNWAKQNPERTLCIYADAPVLDFKSWPAGMGQGKGSRKTWETCLNAYGLTEKEAASFKGLPLYGLESLAQCRNSASACGWPSGSSGSGHGKHRPDGGSPPEAQGKHPSNSQTRMSVIILTASRIPNPSYPFSFRLGKELVRLLSKRLDRQPSFD